MTFEYTVMPVSSNVMAEDLNRAAAHGWRLVHIFEPPYVPHMGSETYTVIFERESNQEGE